MFTGKSHLLLLLKLFSYLLRFKDHGLSWRIFSFTQRRSRRNFQKKVRNSLVLIKKSRLFLEMVSKNKKLSFSLHKKLWWQDLKRYKSNLLFARRLLMISWTAREELSPDSISSHLLIYLISFPMVTTLIKLWSICQRFSKLSRLFILRKMVKDLKLLVWKPVLVKNMSNFPSH